MFAQKLRKIIIGVFTLVSILIVSASGINANAATTTQAVGQNKTFTVTYFNAQNEPGSNPMSLEIFIGNQLQIDVNSFKDTFNSGTANCINSAFILQNVAGWGYYLKYAPRSSTAGNVATCTGAANAGSNVAQPTDIPIGESGTITFSATLTSGNVGDVLTPTNISNLQGIRSVITTNVAGTNYNASADLDITVVAPTSVVVDPDLTTGPGSLGTSTDCVAGTNVTIGQTYSCSWPINGTGPFALPTGGIQARTNQNANNSAPVSTCTITGSVLTCIGISSTGTTAAFTPGAGNVQLGDGVTPTTWPTKSTINLIAAATEVNPNPGGNVGNLTSCTPPANNIIIGSTYSCTFPLTGSGPFTLPAGGIQARTNQGGINSTPITCTVSGAVLTCNGIRTDGSFTTGTGNVQLGSGSSPSTWNNKGTVNLAVAAIVLPRTGGLELTAIGLAIIAIIGGGVYFVIRRKKAKNQI
jgi:LPXTG-motif cell wall-anchored protein